MASIDALRHLRGYLESMVANSPTTKAELQEALDDLVRTAYQNGVEVDNGGYDLFHSEPSIPDWDLTIIRVE